MNLPPYTGTWTDDDRDANFKAQVAEYTRNDPWPTIERLSQNTGIPAEALMALGPRTVEELWDVVTSAEDAGTDAAKVAAFAKLRDMLSWLRVPLEEDYRPG